MKPLIVINFKTYKQGEKALKLAKIIEKIDKNIIIFEPIYHLNSSMVRGGIL